MGPWFNPSIPLERELELERSRRSIKTLTRAQLEAALEALLVQETARDHVLRQAMARLAELELREALRQPAPPFWRWLLGR